MTIRLTKAQATKLKLTSTKPGVAYAKPRYPTSSARGVSDYSSRTSSPSTFKKLL